ncbi:LytTR family transcriptional regulator [Metabacillus sp. KIGAM252]|uniref:LytTR family transcriptional regulator n=1 Tax=Metabacillus flavus TaxID=2823519 RepID=A0ABS5LAC6_9BACI|nr:LytTR family DNA-binding domain-containing protein [Metabacillus flavus]MBS2967666.1 LytTR family transcriptional regulator [Metabacillus flavus]
MKVMIEIDGAMEETVITIQAKEWTTELEELVKRVKASQPGRLIGVKDEQSILLDPAKVDFVYSENRKIIAAADQQRIELKMKLYEVEAMLAPRFFTRFSKSVIGNLHQVEKFELSFNGNLCVYFYSGNKEYVSRSFAGAVKDKLMGGFKNGS